MPAKLFTDANYDGTHPPIGVAITGVNPGDIFLARHNGGWYAYRAVSTGLPDGSVILTDLTTFGPTNGGGSSTLASDTDVTIFSPSDGQVLTFDGPSQKWENKAASGGGAPAWTNVCLLPPMLAEGVVPSGGWGGQTLMISVQGNYLMNAGSKCKINLQCRDLSGAGLKINKAVLRKWPRLPEGYAYGQLISSEQITWDSNPSPQMVYLSNWSDEIATEIDATYSYEIYIYFDSSSDSSSDLQCINLGQSTPYPEGYVLSGDWTAFSDYPVAQSGNGGGVSINGQLWFPGLASFVTA